MTKQLYKSANGKIVDMGSLALQNEMTRAVGNMKVNARGDLIDEHNRVISKKTDQVNQTYNQQTGKTQ
jgi:hypothetical protein